VTLGNLGETLWFSSLELDFLWFWEYGKVLFHPLDVIIVGHPFCDYTWCESEALKAEGSFGNFDTITVTKKSSFGGY